MCFQVFEKEFKKLRKLGKKVKIFKTYRILLMKVEVKVTESFRKAAKPLIKKHKSFLNDLSELETKLLANPETGTSLGNNVYRIRLRIKSKGKSKSSGARVISYLENF